MATEKDSSLQCKSIDSELWREYEWLYDGQIRIYHIDAPQKLFLRPGGTTHRVSDKVGVTHCLPAPGQMGCVLRWKNPDGEVEANF